MRSSTAHTAAAVSLRQRRGGGSACAQHRRSSYRHQHSGRAQASGRSSSTTVAGLRAVATAKRKTFVQHRVAAMPRFLCEMRVRAQQRTVQIRSQTEWTSRPPPFFRQFFCPANCRGSHFAYRSCSLRERGGGIYAPPRSCFACGFAFAKRAYYSMTPSQAASTKPHLLRF